MQTHTCRFQNKLLPDLWRVDGTFKERAWRRHFVCSECGAERPARRPRPPVRVEVASAKPAVAPFSDSIGRLVAEELKRRLSANTSASVPARGLFSALARKGVRGTTVEQWLQAFLEAGWIGLARRLSGSRRLLEAVRVLDREALEEFAAPGARAEWARVRKEALDAIAEVRHPVGEEIAGLLTSAKEKSMSVPVLRALASVALHVEKGDVLAERVFSARYLGDSKAILALRPRLEKLLGPLEALGIREGAAVTLVGGEGTLTAGGQVLDLAALHPYVGLARETFEALQEIRFPKNGLLVVENLAPFEACCRGEVSGSEGCMVLFGAGYPSRTVRIFVDRASKADVVVRAWSDMDLDGVRIARLVASWCTGQFEPFRMDPRAFRSPPSGIPLPVHMATAIRDDLRQRPGALLANTLQSILDTGRWIEQEELLGS
jgi:hypothetical protein